MKRLRGYLLTALWLGALLSSASAQSRGVALFTARVAPSGVLTSSDGVQSAVRDAIGKYTVSFPLNIKDCTYFATIHGAQARMIAVVKSSTRDDDIVVRVFGPDG